MNKREWMLQAALVIPRDDGDGMQGHVKRLAYMYDAICAASPETPQEGAWVEHDGDVSKAPHAGSEVEAVDRDGETYRGLAGDLDWDHTDHGLDIIRWRYA